MSNVPPIANLSSLAVPGSCAGGAGGGGGGAPAAAGGGGGGGVVVVCVLIGLCAMIFLLWSILCKKQPEATPAGGEVTLQRGNL